MADTEPIPPTPPETPSIGEPPHKPPDDSEQVYFEGSPPVRSFEGKAFVCYLIGLILIAIPFAMDRFTDPHTLPPWWVTLVLVLLGVTAFFVPFVLARNIRYRITNYRIDFERGIFSKDIDTLELWHVEDIHFHQSLFNRLLNVGTITVESHDENLPVLNLVGLPSPRPLYETLKQRVISVKRQRGVIKMDPG